MPSTRRSSSTGDIVGWLNSDDVYLPGALRTAVKVFEEHPEIVAVYGEAEFIDSAGNVLGPCTRSSRSASTGSSTSSTTSSSLPRSSVAVPTLRSVDWTGDSPTAWTTTYGSASPSEARCTCHRPLAQVRVYPETKTASGGLARLEEIESMVRRHGRSAAEAVLARDGPRVAAGHCPRGQGEELELGTAPDHDIHEVRVPPCRPSRGPRDRPVAAGASRSACGSPTRDSKGPLAPLRRRGWRRDRCSPRSAADTERVLGGALLPARGVSGRYVR